MNSYRYLVLVLLTTSVACKLQSHSDQKLTHDTLAASFNRNNPVRNYNGENNKLFAFVGHKIAVDSLPHSPGDFDRKFKAKYQILEKVFGNFAHDTIEFIVYDHYGTPEFAAYDNVLLYVSADSGIYYHQKYLYNDVYKTKDGRWAGPYHHFYKQASIRPIKIDFEKPVLYAVKFTINGGVCIRNWPTPYYEKIGDSLRAVYGNYVNDLFLIARDGVLTAREIFKKGKLQ